MSTVVTCPRSTIRLHTVAWPLILILSVALPGHAAERELSGEQLFQRDCAACHITSSESRAPSPEQLAEHSPQAIVRALTDGAMRYQGYALSGAQRRAVASYLTGKPWGSDVTGAESGRCQQPATLENPFDGPRWNGWGPDPSNSHSQSAEMAGLAANAVPTLKLKWSFGFPDSTSAWSQPTVVGGWLFVGSQSANVYALDASTGCIRWHYPALAGVRSAIVIGPYSAPEQSDSQSADGAGATQYAAYFGDMAGNVYAVDASTGAELWRNTVEEHPLVRLTGSPILDEGRLYVPVSSFEESQAAAPEYRCCTFRGSLVAVDAMSGEVIWKTYTIAEKPSPRREKPNGDFLMGPSGGAIWSAPTIDKKRKRVYVAVGNAYTEPEPYTTNAVMAISMEDGEIVWTKQASRNDVYVVGCWRGDNPNCPEDPGPDYDFGTSPILAATPAGRDLIVVGQKSGIGYALDPDKSGEIVWQYRAGLGGALGGIEWGVAADEKYVYFPVADFHRDVPGGLHAVDIKSGERVWYTPPAPPVCGEIGPGCSGAQSAAITVIPGVVFSGAVDGAMRAFSTKDGRVLWQYDTNRDFSTLNGIAAHGGSMIGPGPTVVNGMLYFNAGYGAFGSRAGNVLLAFEPE